MYKTLEDFKEAYKEVLNGWPKHLHELFYDADTLGMNVHWVAVQLNENDWACVYRHIISTLRNQRTCMRFMTYDYDVEAMLAKYQAEFRSHLTSELEYYCND